MSRSFDMAAEYEGNVEQVHQAFADRHYWLARLSDSGADEAMLDSLTPGADGAVDVITTQTLWASRLPGMVAQFHHGDLSFVREERWTQVQDGRATATVIGTIPGAPVTLIGSAALTPAESGTGCRLQFTATVEVRIPLVGGKVETFIGSQLVELLIAEQCFTTEWLRANA